MADRWTDAQDEIIARVDDNYGVYEGRSFREDLFEAYLIRNEIPWPRNKNGHLVLDKDTFKDAARAYPALAQLRELRTALGEMRLNSLAVGSDGRNRTPLWPFQSGTSRNQPGNTDFIFGPSVWLRGLIKPPPGFGLAYIGWSQQEFGIAAWLSRDANMLAASNSGDPYLTFAKQAQGVPDGATKDSHPNERQRFKFCVLGQQYGIGWKTLAHRISGPDTPYPRNTARDLLRAHRETYQTFWRWSDMVQNHAMMFGFLRTTLGWHIHVKLDPNPRSLRNFPMQAAGAEMLRIACCLATEAGIEVCAPVHDAIMIMAPLDRIREETARMRAIMAEASTIVLGGFELRTDEPTESLAWCERLRLNPDEHGSKFPSITRYPDQYMDPRGKAMWDTVMSIINAPPRTKRLQPSIAQYPLHRHAPSNPAPFFDWCRERQSIYEKRAVGLPAPWTDDPILAGNKFCNVFREQDRTTRWFAENVRDWLASSPDVVPATVVFRWSTGYQQAR